MFTKQKCAFRSSSEQTFVPSFKIKKAEDFKSSAFFILCRLMTEIPAMCRIFRIRRIFSQLQELSFLLTYFML